MNGVRKLKLLVPALIFVWALDPVVMQACSACYGDPDSSMSKGLTWGIAVLLGAVVSMLCAITSFFVFVAKRSSTMEKPANSPQEKV